MNPKYFIISMSILLLVTKMTGQELGIENDKLKFDVGPYELANLNYQYFPFGPIYELRSSHYLGTLRLNSLYNIAFRTGGNTVNDVVIDNFGYTKLGSDAPSIKMKMLYGTSASTVTGARQLPHGLGDANRILSVQVHMNFQPGGHDVYYPPEIEFTNQNYTYFWDEYNVTVQNNASAGSTLVLNRPIRVLVIYEQ